MIHSFPTTLIIITTCIIGSILWALICFYFTSENHPSSRPQLELGFPSLVMIPIALVVGYRLFSVNLIFPPTLATSHSTLFLYCLIPAMVIMIASGLAVQIKRSISKEYWHWSSRSFAKVIISYGLDPKKKLRKLVVTKSLTDSWNQALPWVISEIIIVECLFNAPGFGLNLWEAARERNIENLILNLVYIFILYGCLHIFAQTLSHWLGKRLETYG